MDAASNHDWLSLGEDCYVRASDVVGIFGLYFDSDMHKLRESTLQLGVKAIVAMRDGRLVPCFFSPRTMIERMVKSAGPEVAPSDDLLAWQSEFRRDLTEWWGRFGTSDTRIVDSIMRGTELERYVWDEMLQATVPSSPHVTYEFTDRSTGAPLSFKDWLLRAVAVRHPCLLGLRQFGIGSLAKLRVAHAREQETTA